jgi:hypothetical protein
MERNETKQQQKMIINHSVDSTHLPLASTVKQNKTWAAADTTHTQVAD